MASPTAAVISSAGISAPTYAQIYAYLQSQYLAIFGVDTLITPDTQDGQLLAVFANAINDANAVAVAVYNSFSPATAQGAGLSSNVQINGLQRLIPSFSTAPCVLVGAANATITNGSCTDPSGNVWNLPSLIAIGVSGSITTQVTCATAGAVPLSVNTLRINTPTFGWTGVTNSTASLGSPVETDAALRVRQQGSVALPSVTIFEGITAAIGQVPGVTRVKGYENNTSSGIALPVSGTLPANNLDFVVEGGSSVDIAQAIFEKITPGIPTWNANGAANNIGAVVTDLAGSSKLINFQTALQISVPVVVTVHALNGWSAATIPLIQAAVQAFMATVAIGGKISYLTGVVPVASLPGTPQAGTFIVTALTLSGGTVDAQLGFSSAASGTSPVTVNVV